MRPLSDFNSKIRFVLTDIDDTLTHDGRLGPEAYQALWDLHQAGIGVIPVTGRPAGWCEMIARQWPVLGVIGENGAFYFCYKNQKMKRVFSIPETEMRKNQSRLEVIRKEILEKIPGSAVASDQFARINDLAIDFCEDVPALPETEIQRIVAVFKAHGAIAKVSSIHVNGWYGDFDKLSCAKRFLSEELSLSPSEMLRDCVFVGDSPNDEPMWSHFPNSFGVANVVRFVSALKSPPNYVAPSEGGLGFHEISRQILKNSGN